MAWKKGPLPPDTYGWGGVVPTWDKVLCGGFYFADFKGDHVTLAAGGSEVKAEDVAWYDNSLTLPPADVAQLCSV
jgi:hypothetical protein